MSGNRLEKEGQNVPTQDLGEIEPGVRLVRGWFTHDVRLVTEPGQPRIGAWRAGNVFALLTERGSWPLAYPADVEELREPLRSRVLERELSI